MERRFRNKVRFSERENSVVLFESSPDNEESDTRPEPAQRPRVDPRKRARDDASKLMPKSYGDLLCGSFEDPLDNCQDNINAFVLDVPDADHARGLERYLSPQHKDERDGAREDVVEAVLSRQRQLRKQRVRGVQRRNSIHNDGRAQKPILSGDELMEKLRNASRRYSRPSRIFARRLGIADELAVQQMDDCEQDGDDDESDEEEEEISRYPMNPYLCLGSGDNDAKSALANAKMVTRQPSIRELNIGIRSKAAFMNAKKVSRQLSRRELNVSIRNLASTLNASTSDFSSSGSLMHPSLLPRELLRNSTNNGNKRDRALTLPGRSSLSSQQKPSATDCSQLMQNALDLADSEHDTDLRCRSVAMMSA